MSRFGSYQRKRGNSEALPDGFTKYYLSLFSTLSSLVFLGTATYA